MFEKLEDFLAFWKGIAVDRVTASGQVCLAPCFVFSAVIASDGEGEADGDIYDGHSTAGKKRLDLYCVDEAMNQVRFNPPLYFDRGLYVVIGTNCESIVVQYLPVGEKGVA